MMKDIDEFIDKSFIPNNIIYKKIEDNSKYETKYEEIIQLSAIVKLNKSPEEKEYITRRIKEKGIKVIGFSDKIDFESDNYIYTRKYQGRTPKSISKEETQKKLEEYIKTRDINLRNEIVVGNMRLVNYALINLNNNYHAHVYDLQQAGYIGLIKAVENYDPNKGAFSSFALKYINSIIRRELYELKGYKNSEYAFYTITREVEEEYGEKVINNPLLANIIVDRIIENDFRKEHKDDNIRRILINNPVSLDEIIENDEDMDLYNLGYEVEDNPLNSMYDNEMSNILNSQIKTLKEKKQKILQMRYGLNGNKEHTLKEVGKEVDMSHFGVSLIIDKSLDELKRKNKIKSLKSYLYKEV